MACIYMKRRRVGRTAATAAAIALLLTAEGRAVTPSNYEDEIREWRAERQARLTADEGWLTVAGLFWLEPGENRFGSAPENPINLPSGSAPAQAGTFILDEGKGEIRVTAAPGTPLTWSGKPFKEMAVKSDAGGAPDVLALNDLRLFVIKRSKGYAIRMRHLNAPARKSFTGIDYFPIDRSWCIPARFVAYDPPKPVPIANVVGTVDTMLAPGYVEFMHGKRKLRLEPMLEAPESEELFFIFKDETSGEETYPAGRFLYTDLPVEGRVVLDFNRAYNPPCAFTDFATCPLPPPSNRLRIQVTAGEKRYGGH